MVSQLESLKKYSSVVADTGDIDSILKFSPDDCTTNPVSYTHLTLPTI